MLPWRWVSLASTLLLTLARCHGQTNGVVGDGVGSWTAEDVELAKNVSNISLLSRFHTNGQLFTKPYPYIVIRDALDPQVYRRLEATFPSDADILKLNGETERKQNYRYDVRGQLLLGKESADLVSPLWRAFVQHHVSRQFFDEVDAVLKTHIRKSHPIKNQFSTGLRHNDSSADVLLDCQVAMNSPVRVRSAVRGPHLDGPGEVFAGLLYFRHENDHMSTGGDLQTLECTRKPKCVKMGQKDQNKYGTGNTHFRPSDVKVHNTVPYKANQFVLFVNSGKAIHGVTPRSVTHFSRRLVNVVAVRKGVGKLG